MMKRKMTLKIRNPYKTKGSKSKVSKSKVSKSKVSKSKVSKSKVLKKKKTKSKKGGNYPPSGSSNQRQSFFPETRKWADGIPETNLMRAPRNDPVLIPGYEDQSTKYPFPDLKNIDPTTYEHLTPDRLFTMPKTANIGETYEQNQHQPLKNEYEQVDFNSFASYVGGQKKGGYTIIDRIKNLEEKVLELELKTSD